MLCQCAFVGATTQVGAAAPATAASEKGAGVLARVAPSPSPWDAARRAGADPETVRGAELLYLPPESFITPPAANYSIVRTAEELGALFTDAGGADGVHAVIADDVPVVFLDQLTPEDVALHNGEWPRLNCDCKGAALDIRSAAGPDI